jgi:hypothetical protein
LFNPVIYHTHVYQHLPHHSYINRASKVTPHPHTPLLPMTILILSSHLSPCLPTGHSVSGCPNKAEFLTSHAPTCPPTPSSYTASCSRRAAHKERTFITTQKETHFHCL